MLEFSATLKKIIWPARQENTLNQLTVRINQIPFAVTLPSRIDALPGISDGGGKDEPFLISVMPAIKHGGENFYASYSNKKKNKLN